MKYQTKNPARYGYAKIQVHLLKAEVSDIEKCLINLQIMYTKFNS